MRELDPIAVVGAGRLGTAMAAALREAGLVVEGPLRRGETPAASTAVVVLCVPDGAIAEVAAELPRGALVGHCSGATTLQPLSPHRAFSLHPLMTVPENGPTVFAGASAAVAGHPVAWALAKVLGMRAIEVADADRTAYHAAACIASNFLVTIETAAERLAGTTGVGRADLVPLVRATVENWARQGRLALTGPIVRGDTETVAGHRRALRARAPDLLDLYDVLAEVTSR